MKILPILAVLLLSFSAALAQSDEDAIRAVVTSAYINGIHNRGSVDDVRKGFHPSFNMLRLVNNDIKPVPIEDWIATLEKSKKENPAAPPRAEGKFINIDVTGNASVVKLELHREGKKIFTDYLVLHKFEEGWRIVSKTFYRHP